MEENKNENRFQALADNAEMNLDSISPSLLAQIFDDYPEAVIVADTSRRIVYVNHATEKLFGYSKDKLYGKETKILYKNEDDFSEQGKKYFNVTSKIEAESYKVAYRRIDGSVFLGLTTGAVMCTKEGGVIGFIGIVRPARASEQSLDTLQKIHAISSDVSLSDAQKIESLLQVGLSHFNLEIAIQSKISGTDYLVESCIDYNEELSPLTTFDLAGTYCSHTYSAGGPVGFHFAGETEIRNHPCYQNFKLESYIGSPLKLNGELYGTINFSGYAPTEPFCKDDYTLVELLADTVSYLIFKKKVEERLLELAKTDELTGLPNRREVLTRLREYIKLSDRSGISLAVLSIDLDYFKEINDTWGHSAGDVALAGFARIASSFGRETDFCGRMGGEEFVLVLPNTDIWVGLDIGNRLRQRLADRPIDLGNGQSITVSISAGVATLEKGDSVEAILDRADLAMYRAKEGGRDQVCLSEYHCD